MLLAPGCFKVKIALTRPHTLMNYVDKWERGGNNVTANCSKISGLYGINQILERKMQYFANR